MDFLTLCQTTRQECGVQGQGPSAVTDQVGILKKIVDWVQQSDMLIQSMHADWNFLWAEYSKATVLNEDSLAAADDHGMWDLEAFSVNRGTATGHGLEYLEYKDWRKNNNEKAASEPYSITIMPDESLRLRYPADGVYTINGVYWKAPTALSGNADTPVYPVRFHRAAVERAKMYFFMDQEADTLYQEARDQFNYWIGELEGSQLPGQSFRVKGQPEESVARPV